MNHGWTPDIFKIYCPSSLRGILWMPNIFHLNRWKLQSRDEASIGGGMRRKGQEEKDDGGRWNCEHMFTCVCVHRTDQKYPFSNGYTEVNIEVCACSLLLAS